MRWNSTTSRQRRHSADRAPAVPVMRVRLLILIDLGFCTFTAPATAAGAVSRAISATPLAFGKFVLTRNMPSDFTATISLACTATGSGSARIAGTFALVSSGRAREMKAGTNELRYQLCSDPARTITIDDPWSLTTPIAE